MNIIVHLKERSSSSSIFTEIIIYISEIRLTIIWKCACMKEFKSTTIFHHFVYSQEEPNKKCKLLSFECNLFCKLNYESFKCSNFVFRAHTTVEIPHVCEAFGYFSLVFIR